MEPQKKEDELKKLEEKLENLDVAHNSIFEIMNKRRQQMNECQKNK